MAGFTQIASQWLEEVELTRSAATRRLYGLAVGQVVRFLPELEERPITRADLLAFRAARAKQVASSSVNRELRAVRTLLLWSELNELDHPRVQTKRLLLHSHRRGSARSPRTSGSASSRSPAGTSRPRPCSGCAGAPASGLAKR